MTNLLFEWTTTFLRGISDNKSEDLYKPAKTVLIITNNKKNKRDCFILYNY